MSDADGLARGRDRQQVGKPGRLCFFVGAAHETQPSTSIVVAALRRKIRKVSLPQQQATRRLRPIGHESSLKLARHRALHSHMRVAPMTRLMTVAQPCIGYTDTAYVSHPPVDDHEFTVRAMIDVGLDVIPVLAAVFNDFNSRPRHGLPVGIVKFEGAHSINGEMDPHAASGAFAQRRNKQIAHLPRFPDVGFQCDAVLRPGNVCQHGRKNLVAVEQYGGPISGKKICPHQGAKGSGKRVVGHGPRRLDSLIDPLRQGEPANEPGTEKQTEQHRKPTPPPGGTIPRDVGTTPRGSGGGRRRFS